MVESPKKWQIGEVKEKYSKPPKRKWTRKEDKGLISALVRVCQVGWKTEKGTFKSGYITAVEKELKSRLPGCDLKANPHIESRLKLLKRQYDEITAMRGAKGMQWNHKEQRLICKNDDVWNNWLKSHPLAKSMRNKQFPYYEDLHPIFGKRDAQKRLTKGSKGDKVIDGEEAFSERNRIISSYPLYNGGDNSNESFGGRENDFDMLRCSVGNWDERLSDHGYDSGKGDRSNDLNLLVNATTEAEMPAQGEATSSRTANKSHSSSSEHSGSETCGKDQGLKIIGTFLKSCEKHLSLLVNMLGREVAAEQATAVKRGRLNGALRKLPNLSLQARLRAATLIVSDSSKLDLFYSLPEEERSEWVSMLLSGLI